MRLPWYAVSTCSSSSWPDFTGAQWGNSCVEAMEEVLDNQSRGNGVKVFIQNSYLFNVKIMGFWAWTGKGML